MIGIQSMKQSQGALINCRMHEAQRCAGAGCFQDVLKMQLNTILLHVQTSIEMHKAQGAMTPCIPRKYKPDKKR